MSKPEITLHHLNISRSNRLFWLLEELNVPYQVRVYFRLPTRIAPPELREVSPFGKAPVVDLNGEFLTESGSIIDRLISEFPCDDIESPPGKSSIFWSHFSEGSMMSILQSSMIVGATSAGWTRGVVGDLDDREKSGVMKYSKWLREDTLKPQSQDYLDEVEAFLSIHKGKYFSGIDKPGEGDFMMFFPIQSLLVGSRKDAGFTIGPATNAWWDMVMARPAAKRGMDRLEKEEQGQQAKL